MSGCRRLLALINGLPVEAAVWRQDKPSWNQDHELLASLIETIDRWGRIQTDLACGKKVQVPAPVRVTHPDRPEPAAPPKPKVTTDIAEIAAFFQRHVAGERG